MTLATATPPVVRALVRKLQDKRDQGRIVGVHAQPVWTSEPVLEVGGARVEVRPCVSPLAVREALVEHRQAPDGYLVVVTDCTDADLGLGIRAHLARGRLVEVDLWDTVQDSFRAQNIEPAFVRRDKGWAPRALVAHEPAEGWPSAPAGLLTRDVALAALAGAILDVDSDHVDATSLLEWSADAVAVARWNELPAQVSQGLGAWLTERTGAAGALTLRCAATGSAADAVALALVADLLWHADAMPAAVGTSQGLLAARLGGHVPAAAEARAWGRSAELLVAGQLAERTPAGAAVVERAERLLDELGARSVVPLSRFLPAALEQRLSALAAPLRAVLPDPAPGDLAALESGLAVVDEHELASADLRVQTAHMAVRLTRWLADPTPDDVETLAGALDRQARRDAWVDRAYADAYSGDRDPALSAAYADVYSGDRDPALAAAYASLVEAVSARRSRHDEELAFLLADATARDSDLGRVVPVEQALRRLVSPLAAGERGVLLLVIDGMSSAVLTEIAEGLAARRWTELVDTTLGARQALLPVLPTLTEFSRTSLLTGALSSGGSAEEKRHFPSAAGVASVLFHKDDLRAPAGRPLPAEVDDAIGNPAVRVVGVVLNTVDDTLHKLDPGGTAWSVDTVQHLPALLDAARAADRVVVLTSDHGHVVERGSQLAAAPGATAPRWRPAGSPATVGEVEVRGRRVLAPGGAVVLPWREDLRYAQKCAGYHGGASAAEVTVPFTVHVRGAVSELAGWTPAPPPEPVWWHSPLAGVRTEPTTAYVAAPRRETPPTLFDVPSVQDAPSVAAAGGSVVDALLGSDVYAAQRRRAGRTAPDDARVRALLEALGAHGGRLHEATLAAVAGIPATRLRTVLAAVRKLLNVEGYDVLSIDPDQVTVVLDDAMLHEQFRLGSAGSGRA